MTEENTSSQTLTPEALDSPWNENHEVSSSTEKASLLDKTNEKLNNASERVNAATAEIVGKTKERYGELREQVANTTSETQKSIKSSFERHPLAYLAGTLVTGVAIGLALPRSRKEQSALNAQGEKIKNRAENLKSEALNAAKQATNAAASTFEEEMSEPKNPS